MATKRKIFPRAPFHQYINVKLAELLTGPRNATTARRALDTAKLIRYVEIPVLHRDAVAKNLKLVMAHFDLKRSKFFTRRQRSHFYGALDALKEKPTQGGDQHAHGHSNSGEHAPAGGHIATASAGQVAV